MKFDTVETRMNRPKDLPPASLPNTGRGLVDFEARVGPLIATWTLKNLPS